AETELIIPNVRPLHRTVNATEDSDEERIESSVNDQRYCEAAKYRRPQGRDLSLLRRAAYQAAAFAQQKPKPAAVMDRSLKHSEHLIAEFVANVLGIEPEQHTI